MDMLASGSNTKDVAMEVDETEVMKTRDAEMNKIFKLVDIILDLLSAEIKMAGNPEQINKKTIIDLDISDQVAGFLSTTFTALRKIKNEGASAQKFLEYTAKIGTREITVKDVVDKAKGLDLDFMVATPLMNLLTCFKLFYDEVRTGVTKFTVRSDVAKRGMKRKAAGSDTTVPIIKSEERKMNISTFGLTNQHIPLLQGITLPPERRTGLMRSLGPMAQAILLINEDRYPDKLCAALRNSLAMLPMNAEIASCLKDAKTPGAVQGVMSELGDILIMSTARSTQKLYLPLFFARFLWKNKEGLKRWNFAGHQMMHFIDKIVDKHNIYFKMKSGGSSVETSQAVFHAMFGTYLEDLGALSQITNLGTWSQRKGLNQVFTKRSEKAAVEFQPVKFLLYSKMAQSLLSNNMGNVDPCHTTRPSFAGRRKRSFSQALVTYLKTGRNISNYSTDPLQLQMALKRIKDELIVCLDNQKLDLVGTKDWMAADSKGELVDSDKVVQESGVTFYGATQK